MKRSMLWTLALVTGAAGFALGAETRKPLVSTYASIADSILAAKHSEVGIVTLILGSHRTAAHRAFAEGKWEDCAAEMSLFANEGDNAIGGIRKRLLEGGHHHNAEGEAKGTYEEGYVLVTKQAKVACLDAAKSLQSAADDAGRKAAWDAFDKVATGLLHGE